MIYLDNSATTQTRPEVAEFVAKYSVEHFFNPSSIYHPAIEVRNDLNRARETLLELLGVKGRGRIIFTGSATEANNLVLNGLSRKNKKILVSQGEHPSVFEVAKNLKNSGFEVDFVNLSADGTLDLDDLRQKLDTDTGLVSFIHVSNETGAINDIAKISSIVKSVSPDCIVHCDGVQAFGKLRINLSSANIDAYTMSSHKIHGPKGVASLFVRDGLVLKPHILGGGQEGGLRSGTENPAGILGFVLASQLMYHDFDVKCEIMAKLWQYFVERLSESGVDYHINSPQNGLKNILSVSFGGVRGEVLLHCLEKHEIFVSTGSACSSKTIGNRVLQAMKQSNETMLGNIRFSFCEFNTESEIDAVVEALRQEIPRIKH